MSKPTRRRVVITGMGVISAVGSTLEQFWSALVDGRSAVRPIARFDASSYPSRIAAAVDDDSWGGPLSLSREWQTQGRIAWYAAAAARRAACAAGLADAAADRSRVGVAVATGMGRYHHREIFRPCASAVDAIGTIDAKRLNRGLVDEAEPAGLDRRTPGSIVARLAAEYRCEGPVLAVMTACAGGTQAIGDAARWIRLGQCEVVLAGGADSELYPMGLASFSLLGALSRRNDAPTSASRPFDRERDGFVMGEGAGMLVLEERNHALARGAHVYAEIAGFGASADAWRVTDPHPEGAGAVLAMSRALRDAGRSAADVHYINAHGTSTIANDRSESRAIRQLFGTHADDVPVSSIKGVLGHATVAAGALEVVATTLAIQHGMIPPTAGLATPDPECDLDYVPREARRRPVTLALSNSFAFGGQAAVLALCHPES
jgi:3-oxoacyl-[acyl-carrier-protein] synthase II